MLDTIKNFGKKILGKGDQTEEKTPEEAGAKVEEDKFCKKCHSLLNNQDGSILKECMACGQDQTEEIGIGMETIAKLIEERQEQVLETQAGTEDMPLSPDSIDQMIAETQQTSEDSTIEEETSWQRAIFCHQCGASLTTKICDICGAENRVPEGYSYKPPEDSDDNDYEHHDDGETQKMVDELFEEIDEEKAEECFPAKMARFISSLSPAQMYLIIVIISLVIVAFSNMFQSKETPEPANTVQIQKLLSEAPQVAKDICSRGFERKQSADLMNSMLEIVPAEQLKKHPNGALLIAIQEYFNFWQKEKITEKDFNDFQKNYSFLKLNNVKPEKTAESRILQEAFYRFEKSEEDEIHDMQILLNKRRIGLKNLRRKFN